jgi:DNA replication and repair protein RecF
VLVTAVEASPVRNLNAARVELDGGIVSLVGPNGVGKTNLLEALYFALTGRSFRTSDRRDLIPFGAPLARAEAVIRDEDGVEHRLLASVSRSEGRRHLLDGDPVDPATAARHRPPVAVFSPDRLALIKDHPASGGRISTAMWPPAGLRGLGCVSDTARRSRSAMPFSPALPAERPASTWRPGTERSRRPPRR